MCTRPLSVHVSNARGDKWHVVPCGKCDDCKRRYQNDWSIRLSNECLNWSNVWFITLTYKPSAIPTTVDPLTGQMCHSVNKRHIQNWLKRFRIRYLREYGEVVHLKYFLTSEYGPSTLRPHYHMLLFGLERYDVKDLCNEWNRLYGFTYVKKVKHSNSDSFAVSRYVAKYCAKGTFENPLVAQKLVKPTFHLISKGIGLNYVIRNKQFHLQNREFDGCKCIKLDNGSICYNPLYISAITDVRNVVVLTKDGSPITFAMPRYYKEKIYGVQNNLSDAIAQEILQRADKLRIERAKQLQTLHKDWSFDAAYGYTFLEDSKRNLAKESRLRETNARFYNKSKL